ncbi:hypothetical protein NUW54_g11392 [Trametes sanguinea]|uniref:Uncharacterized protein n=1 Tax=Trametes sanguinea TaxID=158606 RepID=A0ACC1NF98_9APHY|nr:hypothetical protein NUW54_g11392 [Trametes sanguinea]
MCMAQAYLEANAIHLQELWAKKEKDACVVTRVVRYLPESHSELLMMFEIKHTLRRMFAAGVSTHVPNRFSEILARSVARHFRRLYECPSLPPRPRLCLQPESPRKAPPALQADVSVVHTGDRDMRATTRLTLTIAMLHHGHEHLEIIPDAAISRHSEPDDDYRTQRTHARQPFRSMRHEGGEREGSHAPRRPRCLVQRSTLVQFSPIISLYRKPWTWTGVGEVSGGLGSPRDVSLLDNADYSILSSLPVALPSSVQRLTLAAQPITPQLIHFPECNQKYTTLPPFSLLL